MDNQYHPKTAFALFLNQAEHNLEKALQDVTNRKKGFKEPEQVKMCIKELNKDQMYLLESKYFKLLRTHYNNNREEYSSFAKFIETETESINNEKDKQAKILEIKKNILGYTFERLNNFRNYYSHFYHRKYDKDQKSIFAIGKGSEEDKYLRQFLEMRFEDAKEFYLNFTHQTPEGIENEYKPEDLSHLNLSDKYYQFFNFNFNNNNYYFDNGEIKFKRQNHKSTVFLASFFLTKRQINLFLDQVKGFKRSADKQAQATRDVFTHFCMKTESHFKSENTDVRFFIDVFTHLSKVPRLAFENFKKGNIEIIISPEVLNKTRNLIFQQEKPENKYDINDTKFLNALKIDQEFEKLYQIVDDTFKDTNALKTKIDEIIDENVIGLIGGKEKYENYKDMLINFALNDEQIRTSRDRFTEFALQFIDDFQLFKKIKFKVYTGRVFEIQQIKTYHGKKSFERTYIKPEKIYSRINEIERTQTKKEKLDLKSLFKDTECKKITNIEVYDNVEEPRYFIKNNNIFFEVETKYGKQKASMSIHELRNLAFATMLLKEKVEEAIIKYVENYRELLDEILSGKNPSEITYDIPDKELPKYIVKYLKQETASDESLKQAIINRLNYIHNFAETQKKKIKTLRKYEKIREIIKFVNRFNEKLRGDKREYLDLKQHQELEKLLGTFPKSEKELVKFLQDNEITTQFADFKSFVQSRPDLTSILYKVFGIYITWTKRSIKKVENSNDIEFLKSIARIINVTKPDYSFDRIKQNIENLLKENIVIPRGFIKQRFFGGKGLSKIIDSKVKDDEIGSFWSKIEDVYSIAQNSTENKRQKYKIAKTLNEERLKDKVLLF